MEDKIKKVLDSLEYSEAESLIGDIDVSQPSDSKDSESMLDYSRIKNMVYKKTGVRCKKHFRMNKYVFVAAAACLVFMVGTIAIAAHTFFFDNFNMKNHKIALIDDYETSFDDESWILEEYSGESDADCDGESEDKDKKDKDKIKDKPKKSDKDKPASRPSNENVASGDNEIDEYESMPSSDVDELISDSTSEIDMDSFVVKYKSVDEMIDDSDYIVRGVKTQSILESSEDKDVYNLIAEFKVNSLLVDNIGDDIEDKILVNEGIKYNSKEEKVIHVGGYKSMINKKEYILFLKNTSEGNFRIAGLVYGKVPVDTNEYVVDIDDSYSKNKYIVKLINIIDDARKRFLQKEDNINVNETDSPEDDADDNIDDEDDFPDEEYDSNESDNNS